jgi:uncharacterized protein
MKLCATLLLLFALTPLAAQAEDCLKYHTLHVTGTYNVKAKPDISYVDFTVQSEAKEVAEAKKKADEVLRAVKDAATKLSIAEKDLKTGYVSIQPRYTYLENRPPLLDGYNVSYNLTMTVRKLETLGESVQQLVQAGVTQVNNVRYDIEDSESFKRDALKQATLNAKAKADVLAAATGETLVGALRVQEGSVGYNPSVIAMEAAPMMAKMMSSDTSAGGEVPPAGELDVNAQVSIIYELKD